MTAENEVMVVNDWSFWEQHLEADAVKLMRCVCALTDPIRKVMTMPFAVDGRVYATNGKLLVSWYVEALKGQMVSCMSEPPPAAGKVLRPEMFAGCEWVECGDISIPEVENKKCDLCGGSGEVSCHSCGHTEECGSCDGVGLLSDMGTCQISVHTVRALYLRLLGKTGWAISFHPVGDLVEPAYLRLRNGGMGRVQQLKEGNLR